MIGQHLLRIIYRRRPGRHPLLYKETIKFLEEVEGDTLDVGGGPGYLYLYIKEKPYYVVQDIDYIMLTYGDPEIDRVQAAAEELVFRRGSFENIIIHDALHHFRDVNKTLSNIASIASKKIMIFEIELGTLTGKFIKYLELLLGFPGNFYKSMDLKKKIEKIFQDSRIDIVKMGRFRYLLKAVRQPHS